MPETRSLPSGPINKAVLSEELILRFEESARFQRILNKAEFPVSEIDFSTGAGAVGDFMKLLNSADRSLVLSAFEQLSHAAPVSDLLRAIVAKLKTNRNYTNFFPEILETIDPNFPVNMPGELHEADIVDILSTTTSFGGSEDEVREQAPGAQENTASSLPEWQRRRIEVVHVGQDENAALEFTPCSAGTTCPVQPIAMCALGELTRTGADIAETYEVLGFLETLLSSLLAVKSGVSSPDDQRRLLFSKAQETIKSFHDTLAGYAEARKYPTKLEKGSLNCETCAWLEAFLCHRTNLKSASQQFAKDFGLIYHKIQELSANGTLVYNWTYLCNDDSFFPALDRCLEWGEKVITSLRGAIIPSRHASLCFLSKKLRTGADELSQDLHAHLISLYKNRSMTGAPVFKETELP